jgi:mono/diheme cytochrome c family protein
MMPKLSRPGRRALTIASAIAALVVLLTGCGETVGYTEGNGDKTNGKELFTAKCGSCHTLADAGTAGTIGPNLDDAFAESRRNGLGESTFVQVVRDQIAYAIETTSTGAPGMPRDLVTGQDAIDVASYVASVAGTGKGPVAPAPATATTEAPAEPGSAGDAAAGKVIFTDSCGSCHTLADAGTSGSVGPNLDDAMPSAALVTERVTGGKGVMPSFSDSLTPAQIADVSAYVSGAAGK